MILYEGAKFHIDFLWRMQGSVIPFSIGVGFPCAALTVGLKLLSYRVLSGSSYWVLGLDMGPDMVAGAAFSGLSFLIGFLVVFRAQSAYNRFWEGCSAIQQMQGEWFDAASSLIAFCKCSTGPKRDIVLFQHALVRLMSMLNACVLMELSAGWDRDAADSSSTRAFELELIDAEGIDMESLKSINQASAKVELLFQWLQQLIVESNVRQVFSVAPPILSRAFQELANGMVCYRAASKIARIPLPFPYVQATELLLLSHWLVTPALMCMWISSPLWGAVLTFVQVTFFWSLNSIATELENPFGEDVNDLPAQEIQTDFNERLLLLIRPSTQRTARLSSQAAFEETEEHSGDGSRDGGRKVTLGKAVPMMSTGITTPTIMNGGRRKSSLESNRITLGHLSKSLKLKPTNMDLSPRSPRGDACRSNSKKPTLQSTISPRHAALSSQPGTSSVSLAIAAAAAAAAVPESDEEDSSEPESPNRKREDHWEQVSTTLNRLPELVEICSEMRDEVKVIQATGHLSFLPELAKACTELRDILPQILEKPKAVTELKSEKLQMDLEAAIHQDVYLRQSAQGRGGRQMPGDAGCLSLGGACSSREQPSAVPPPNLWSTRRSIRQNK